jgi:hypothetical protein
MLLRSFVPTTEPGRFCMKSNGNYLEFDLSWWKSERHMIGVDAGFVGFQFLPPDVMACTKPSCHRPRPCRQSWSGKPKRIFSNGDRPYWARAHFLHSRSSESGSNFYGGCCWSHSPCSFSCVCVGRYSVAVDTSVCPIPFLTAAYPCIFIFLGLIMHWR